MQKFNEFVNEGFFENDYLRYKNKVAQILESLEIVIDRSSVGKAEECISDSYHDRVDAFDCARAIRDDIRSSDKLSESIEQYAADVINSCPEHRRRFAVSLIHGASRIQKGRFDHITDRIADILGMDLQSVISAYGFELLELICNGDLSDDEIIQKYAAMGTLLAKIDMKREMDLEEAMKIIEDAGVSITPTSFVQELYASLVKEFRNEEAGHEISFDEASSKIYIKDGDSPWLNITYIPKADKVCLENVDSHDSEYVEYYPKLQGGPEGIANRIRNRYGNQ